MQLRQLSTTVNVTGVRGREVIDSRGNPTVEVCNMSSSIANVVDSFVFDS